MVKTKAIKLMVQPVLTLVMKSLHFVRINILLDISVVVRIILDRTIVLVVLVFIVMNVQKHTHKIIDKMFYVN